MVDRYLPYTRLVLYDRGLLGFINVLSKGIYWQGSTEIHGLAETGLTTAEQNQNLILHLERLVGQHTKPTPYFLG